MTAPSPVDSFPDAVSVAQALADVGIELFSEETVEVLIDRIRSINAAVSV